MCIRKINVRDFDGPRDAYEAEQYLLGLSYVDDVSVDWIDKSLVVEYDETSADYNEVLDEVEHSGCIPNERVGGILDQIRMKLSG